MILAFIKLNNFRSHKKTELEFSEKLNFIIGGNGQGKTSVLESIYYLCTTKSDSAKSDIEVLRFDEENFEIVGQFKDSTESKVRVFFSKQDNRKYYFKDDKQVSRSAEIIGKFPVVLLTPSDHSITQGAPADRRKFVDSVISQASGNYLKTLLDYNKVLKQRSSLLFQIKENRRPGLIEELDAWTDKLVSSGTDIINYRKKFVEDFKNYISDSYKVILDEDEFPEIKYTYLDNSQGDDVKEEFYSLIKRKRDEELRRASNLVGPHRDDFIFEINNLNLRTYGSQGQHKTFQVVLRFAEFFYLKQVIGRSPIFLLDDVFGELDSSRSVKISEYLRSVGQAFITLTDFTNISFLERNQSDRYINISSGNIAYV